MGGYYSATRPSPASLDAAAARGAPPSSRVLRCAARKTSTKAPPSSSLSSTTTEWSTVRSAFTQLVRVRRWSPIVLVSTIVSFSIHARYVHLRKSGERGVRVSVSALEFAR